MMKNKLGRVSLLAFVAVLTLGGTGVSEANGVSGKSRYIEPLSQMLHNTVSVPTQVDVVKSRISFGNKFDSGYPTKFNPVFNLNSQYFVSNPDVLDDYTMDHSFGLNLRYSREGGSGISSAISLMSNYTSSYAAYNDMRLGMMINGGIGNNTSDASISPDLMLGVNGFVGYYDDVYSLAANVGTGLQYKFSTSDSNGKHTLAGIIFGNFEYTIPLDIEKGLTMSAHITSGLYDFVGQAEGGYSVPFTAGGSVGYQIDSSWGVAVNYDAVNDSIKSGGNGWKHILSLTLYASVER